MIDSLNRQGDKVAAQALYQKAVDVTPEMAALLIRTLKDSGVECIVAPYEADAQLAYLSKTGYVDAIITEDSDLIPYGSTTVTLLSLTVRHYSSLINMARLMS